MVRAARLPILLVQAGVAELAIAERDAARRDDLIARLQGLGLGKISVGLETIQLVLMWC